MPEVVIASIAYASTAGPAVFTISAATVAQVAFVATSIAYSRAQSRKAAKRTGAELKDRTQTTSGSAEAKTIVFGRTRVGGVQLAPGWTHGATKEYWTVPVAFAGHPIESFDEVWFDDASIGTLDGTTGGVTGGKFRKTFQTPKSAVATGGAASTTYTVPGGADVLRVDLVAIIEPGASTEPVVAPSRLLTEGTDYSVATVGSDKVITWITDQTGVDLAVSYTEESGPVHAYVRKFLGNPAGERDTELETYSNGEWTSTDVGNSIARLHITYVFDQDIYPQGPPQLSAVIKGAKVYDPRLDSTNGGSGSHRFDTPSTWAWSENPALAWAWYMTSDLGLACVSSEIDWPSVITAANICDELVPVDGDSTTQVRYTCNGVLSTEDEIRSNVLKILSSMVGTCFFSGGKWYLRAGAYSTPTLDLTDDDFGPGGVQVLPRTKRRELFNAVKGLYVDAHAAGELGSGDAGGFWQLTNFPPYESSTFKTQDNGELLWSDEIELPMTTDWRRAQRIAKLMLYRARQSMRVVANFKAKTVPLQPGDTCRITHALNGWSNKVFRVIDRTYTPHGNPPVSLVLQEESSAIYDWTYSEAIDPDPAPNTALPDPRVVPALQNFAISTGSSYTLPDGTVVPFCTVSWSPITDSAVLSGGRIEIWHKRASDTTYTQRTVSPAEIAIRIEPVSASDTIQAFAWVINGSQVRSRLPAFAVANMRADLPTGAAVQPISANRLPSSMFSDGVLGLWGTAYGLGGTAASAINVARHPSADYYVLGVTSSVLMSIDDAYAGTGRGAAWPSALMAVDAGQRYCAFAGLIGWETDCYVAIEWLDVSQNSLGAPQDGNVIIGVPAESPTRRFNDPSHYRSSTVFATAPAGAAYARLLIVAGGTWSGAASKYVGIHQPYFGEIQSGIAIAPAWGPGGGDAVTTKQLAPETATIVRRGTQIQGPVTLSALNTSGAPLFAIEVAADLRGCEIACTATMEAQIVNAGAPGVLSIAMVVRMTSDNTGSFVGGPIRTLYRDTIPTGADLTRPIEQTERFEVLAEGNDSGPQTFRLWVGLRGGATAATAAISFVDFAIEVIKR